MTESNSERCVYCDGDPWAYGTCPAMPLGVGHLTAAEAGVISLRRRRALKRVLRDLRRKAKEAS